MTDSDDDLGRRYAEAMGRHRDRVLTPEDEELLRELLRSRESKHKAVEDE